MLACHFAKFQVLSMYYCGCKVWLMSSPNPRDQFKIKNCWCHRCRCEGTKSSPSGHLLGKMTHKCDNFWFVGAEDSWLNKCRIYFWTQRITSIMDTSNSEWLGLCLFLSCVALEMTICGFGLIWLCLDVMLWFLEAMEPGLKSFLNYVRAGNDTYLAP